MEGSWFKSRCGQNLGGVLVAGGGDRTPSEHHLGTIRQDSESPNAHLGPWMSCHLIQVHPAFTHMQLGEAPAPSA